MDKGYDYDELFPGRFLKAGEFKDRDVTLKIASVEIEELPDKKGTKINKDGERVRTRGIVGFEKTEKQLCLNRTNGECIKALFGRKTNDWIGKRVTFFPCVVDAFGEPTPAIRVRGSPDIAQDITFTLRLSQKKDKLVTLKRTGQVNGRAAAPAQQPAPAAPAQQDDGELPYDPPESQAEEQIEFGQPQQ